MVWAEPKGLNAQEVSPIAEERSLARPPPFPRSDWLAKILPIEEPQPIGRRPRRLSRRLRRLRSVRRPVKRRGSARIAAANRIGRGQSVALNLEQKGTAEQTHRDQDPEHSGNSEDFRGHGLAVDGDTYLARQGGDPGLIPFS